MCGLAAPDSEMGQSPERAASSPVASGRRGSIISLGGKEKPRGWTPETHAGTQAS